MDFTTEDYRIFELFNKRWALVSAGTPEHSNACTISWGSFGTLWSKPVVTVYLHPSRYTKSWLDENELFTVSFFPEEYRTALAYMGSHSGRDGDKAAAAGLTPVGFGGGVTFREAERAFVCRKLYESPFAKETLAEEISAHYRDNPKAFPPDENGDWEPHWLYVGEVVADSASGE